MNFFVSVAIGILGGLSVIIVGAKIAIGSISKAGAALLIKVIPYSAWPTWLQMLIMVPNALLAGYGFWAWWPKSKGEWRRFGGCWCVQS